VRNLGDPVDRSGPPLYGKNLAAVAARSVDAYRVIVSAGPIERLRGGKNGKPAGIMTGHEVDRLVVKSGGGVTADWRFQDGSAMESRRARHLRAFGPVAQPDRATVS
jgi:hypothetical protein